MLFVSKPIMNVLLLLLEGIARFSLLSVADLNLGFIVT